MALTGAYFEDGAGPQDGRDDSMRKLRRSKVYVWRLSFVPMSAAYWRLYAAAPRVA